MRREIYTHKFFNLKGLFPQLHPQLLQKKKKKIGALFIALGP